MLAFLVVKSLLIEVNYFSEIFEYPAPYQYSLQYFCVQLDEQSDNYTSNSIFTILLSIHSDEYRQFHSSLNERVLYMYSNKHRWYYCSPCQRELNNLVSRIYYPLYSIFNGYYIHTLSESIHLINSVQVLLGYINCNLILTVIVFVIVI